MFETLRLTYQIFPILALLISFLLLRSKQKLKVEDSIIIYTLFIFNFFDIFLWLLPNHRKTGVLCYDILFPIFTISIILFKKHKNIATILVIAISIACVCILQSSTSIPILAHFKIALSFTACITILYVVFKNIHRARMQVFLLLLLAGITFMDMFFNAAMFKIIPFDMHNWKIFLSCYIVYLSIINSMYIYYYGRQLFKH